MFRQTEHGEPRFPSRKSTDRSTSPWPLSVAAYNAKKWAIWGAVAGSSPDWGVAAAAANGLYLAGEPLPLPGGILPVCPTTALFGIDCPGCGSLRMIYSLLHLDVTSAVHYNALGQVAVLLLLWAFRAWTYGRLVGRRVEVRNTRGGLGRPPLR